eukprot:TRINITY_DN1906_c0_g1_i1.p4 TRINITY_DN1906_c0_g1~~TRINITY_DN1906_c0_g1_i1.p4  ORF type:complete len:58 (-),score=17.85 TRINITY_DN1906_c0_g1_i1:47-220(-)
MKPLHWKRYNKKKAAKTVFRDIHEDMSNVDYTEIENLFCVPKKKKKPKKKEKSTELA